LTLGFLLNLAVACACAAWCPPRPPSYTFGIVANTSGTRHIAVPPRLANKDPRFLTGVIYTNWGVTVTWYYDALSEGGAFQDAGLPLRCLSAHGLHRDFPTGRPLPAAVAGFSAQPLWRGLALNTLLYAGLVWAVWFGPGVVRRRRRRRRGLCVRCGYDLKGLSDGACPECGAERPAPRSVPD
jgi:hypothetical protein